MDNASYILTLSLAQFKLFKAAMRILMRSGITREVATEILVDAHRKSYEIPRIIRRGVMT